MTSIRLYRDTDWPGVWSILEPVFRAGDSYSFAADISESDSRNAWIEIPAVTFVAESDSGDIVASYYIKPTQPGQGAHVCNCGYVVGADAQRKGIASLMCGHSQQEARARGFRAMQFNLVVSTNDVAVRLWQKHGFDIVGTLPEAFDHPAQGYVDAYIMYKMLEAQ